MMDLDRVNNYLARVEESEKTTFKPVGSRLKVGVDLGTATLCWWCWTRKTTPWPARSRRPRFCGTRGGGLHRRAAHCTVAQGKLEARLGTELVNCAIAMPAGTESSVKTHQYVAEARPGGDQHPGRAQRRQRHLSD